MILIYCPLEGGRLSRPRHCSQCAARAQSCVSQWFLWKHKLLPAARFEPGSSRAAGKRVTNRPLRPVWIHHPANVACYLSTDIPRRDRSSPILLHTAATSFRFPLLSILRFSFCNSVTMRNIMWAITEKTEIQQKVTWSAHHWQNNKRVTTIIDVIHTKPKTTLTQLLNS